MKYLNYFFISACALLLLCFLGFTLWANTELAEGQFSLFMDEMVGFIGVEKILHPVNFKSFLFAIYDGLDHRYGRSMWNVMAFFSYIPEKIWGEPGQIIAGRMIQVFLIIASYILIIKHFLKTWPLRFFLLFLLLVMPYTEYYATTPKPEPLQFLCLILFLIFYQKNNLQLTGRYWVFIGIAFGTKISTLPLLLLFMGYSSVPLLAGKKIDELIQGIVSAIFYTLCGLTVAIPMLFPFTAGSIFTYFVFTTLFKKVAIYKKSLEKYFLFFSTFSLLLITGINTYFIFVKKNSAIHKWIFATIFSTGHGQDNSTITFLSWYNFFAKYWMHNSQLLAAIFLLLNLLLIILYLKQRVISKNTFFPLIIQSSGLILTVLIFLKVQRLWGMYLYMGVTLFITGTLMLLEYFLKQKKINLVSLISCMLIIVTGYIAFSWIQPTYHNFEQLATRTQSEKYKIQYADYLVLKEYIDNHANGGNDFAYISLRFFNITHSKCKMVAFGGIFNEQGWQGHARFVILDSTSFPNYPPSSVMYERSIEGRKSYSIHVINENPLCEEHCYEESILLPSGGKILTRVR